MRLWQFMWPSPRCPMCSSREHLSADWHDWQFQKLMREIRRLQAQLLTAEQDQFDEAIIDIYAALLATAINEIYAQAALLCINSVYVSEHIRADVNR